MNRHTPLAAVVVALVAFGVVGAATAAPLPSPVPAPLPVSASPAAAWPTLPAGGDLAVAAVSDARSAVDAQPKYVLTCEPAADARFDNPDDPSMITNKDCPAIQAAKEAAHEAFADQTWVDGECIGYGCSPEQDAEINAGEAAAQDEYWARCANTPSGVDGC